MTCSCGNLQCYVCGESIKDYKHFEEAGKEGKKCPLYEKNDKRLDTKIRNAQADAVKKVLEEEEGLNEEDVKVDIPTAKTINAQPMHQHLPHRHIHLQQPHQHLQQLHQQQHLQQQQGLPPFPFFPNVTTPQFNWNIPAFPNVFPFQVNLSL